MKPIKITTAVIALTAIAAPAIAGDFTLLDANSDGQVSFAEYKAVATANGKTVTLAAQEFTRMAQGDAVLTEDEFFLANALVDQPYALQSLTATEPLLYVPVETVSDMEPVESYPAKVEAIEPPVEAPEMSEDTTQTEDKNMSEPVVIEKPIEQPLEVDPVVAGELETSESLTEETPVEEGLSDLPNEDVETESDTESEMTDEVIDEISEDIQDEKNEIY